MKLRIAALALLAMTTYAAAMEFRSSYLRFELPDGWTCRLEVTEFVCSPPLAAGEKASSIMIFTAKEEGPDDSFTEYRKHLESEGEKRGPGGVIKPPTIMRIGDTLWIDATISGSEIPNYYTRYLATVKNGIALLVTFSAHSSVFDQLSGQAALAIHTARILDDWRKTTGVDRQSATGP